MPGAPTVYYGDEVGVTGDDDPDDRRTYPWTDLGGSPDQALFTHYQKLNGIRKANDALVHGDFRVLLADDAANVVAYGRKTGSQAAIIVINRSAETQNVSIPVGGYLPNGISLNQAYVVGTGGPGSVSVSGGSVSTSLGAMSAIILLSGKADLTPTAAPTNLHVTGEGNKTVDLAWNSVSGSAGYNVYRSPVSGGGWVKANSSTVSGTTFSDSNLRNAQTYYYVVTSLDAAGNESKNSNEVSALPHLTIGWANLQWPPTMTHTISATDRTDEAYGQVWIDGETNQPGATPSLRAQLGFGPAGSDPTGANWTWEEASFNVDSGSNDEFKASLLPETTGVFDYTYRYTTTDGRDWFYAVNGPNNSSSPFGQLTVNASSDTTAPTTPTGLTVASASPAGVNLTWDAISGD